MKCLIVRRALVLLAGMLLFLNGVRCMPAYAHFNTTGYSDIAIKGNSIHYDLYLDTKIMSELFNIDPDKDGAIAEQDLTKHLPMFTAFITDYLIVSNNGIVGKVKLDQAREEKRGELSTIHLVLVYDFDQPLKDYQIDYRFFYDGLDPGHQNFAVIKSGGNPYERVIVQSSHILHGTAGDVSAGTRPADSVATSRWATLYQYTGMGVRHILSGYDHLLFLVGLLLGGGSRRNIIMMISSFTLGHSVTLALASLELVTLPASVIEPMIALSIVYITVENVLWRSRNWRWLVALFFGLVHGFGFADILRGSLSSNFALPLFSFNIGVELTQLSVLFICLPILRYLGKVRWQQRVRLCTSGIVGLIGIYWFVERIM